MLTYNVQSRLLAILWVTKTIHKEEPMYAVLDKVTIKSEILSYLSTAKRGFDTKSCLIEIINAILYKLKTGYQWKHLPVESLFTTTVLSNGAVFHHFNKWHKAREWKDLWLNLLDRHRTEFDKSMFNDLAKANVKTDRLFLNADAGFDCDILRNCLDRNGVVANICISKRRTKTDDIVLDEQLYAERYFIERTNAWMDSYRTLLNRFDTTVSSWEY